MPTVQKLESTDGFVVVDFDQTPSVGVLRVARKILESSATDLCRSATYSLAFHRIQRSGASAGLNAEGDAVGAALEALTTELAEQGRSGDLTLLSAKGVPDRADLGPVGFNAATARLDEALAASVLASCRWAVGNLDGRRVAVEQSPNPTGLQAPEAVLGALTDAGMEIVDVDGVADKPWKIWGADVDLIIAGSKPGVLNHQGADMVKAQAVVPWGPIPITTRALAVLSRRQIRYVPDFVSAAGTVLLAVGDDEFTDTDSIASATSEGLDRVDAETDGLFLGAAAVAEEFLSSWRDRLPFGRPLAA